MYTFYIILASIIFRYHLCKHFVQRKFVLDSDQGLTLTTVTIEKALGERNLTISNKKMLREVRCKSDCGSLYYLPQYTRQDRMKMHEQY